MKKKLYQLLVAFCLLSLGLNAQISGTVYRDFNGNGIQGTTAPNKEPGVANIIINVYNASDILIASYQSVANGTYSIPSSGLAYNNTQGSNTGFVPNALPVRVEFIMPTTNVNISGPLNGVDYSSTAGSVYGSSIQFVTGGSTSINFAINAPDDYVVNTNPYLATTNYVNGSYNNSTSGPSSSFYTFQYGSNSGVPNTKGVQSQTGAVWGVAYQQSTKTMYTSAVLRRFVGFGPLGPGGIYKASMTNPTSNSGVSNFVDVASIGIPVGIDMRTASGCNSVSTDINLPSNDTAAALKVGTFGIGGIEYDTKRNALWLVNLTNRNLYRINNINPNTTPVASDVQGGFPIILPSPYTLMQGDLRPWAVKAYRGFIFVGAVSDGRYTHYGDPNELNGYVLKFDPENPSLGFTVVYSFPLNYVRGRQAGATQYFNEWGDPDYPGNEWITTYGGNQPLLSDIEFDVDGSIIVGLMDKSSNQRGLNQYNEVKCSSSIGSGGNATGDIVRICNTPSGYVFEGAVGCTTTIPPINVILNPNNGNAPISEYYWGDFGPDTSGVSQFNENALGALAYLPGTGQVISTVMDAQTLEANGVITFSNTNGGPDNRYNIYGSSTPNTMGKTNGIGDIELVSDLAPIEIGNRVWIDANGDGIQNANELGILGVTVELYQGVTLVGTSTTDANGNYYFNNSNVILNGATGILPNTAYCIKVPNSQGGSKQIALGTNSLTTANTDATSNGDERDSDGSLNGNEAEVCFTTGMNGENKHSFDFGFSPAPCTLSTVPDLTVAGISFGPGVAPLSENVTLNAGANVLNESNVAGFNFSSSSEGAFYTVCTEITQPVLPLQNPYLHVFNGSTEGFTATQALHIAQIFQAAGFNSTTGFGAGNNTVVNFVALQAAVWNAMYDADYSVTAGPFQLLTDNNGARALANSWLSSAQNITTPSVVVHRLHHASGQDLVMIGDVPPITVNPTAPTCAGNNGGLTINGFTAGQRYQYSTGTTFTSGTAIPASITAIPVGGVIVSNLPNTTGTYTVRVYDATDDNCYTDRTVSINPTICPACLGNYVFNDMNQDGLQNNGEVGVAGVTTTLYNATNNTILATVTTDAYGYYQFCQLTPGDYKVGFSLPTNYVFTTANAGTDDALDSDPSNITGLTATVTLASGDSNMTVDAGIYQPQPATATVGDKVWFDANSNGIQDPTENGVSGVTVTLYNCANPTVPVATTITGANGNYIFENVAPGSYAVSFTAPTGTTFTTQTGTTTTTDNSDVDATGKTACFPVVSGDKITYVDAGIIPQTPTNASLGDKVWNDANQDGIQDATETGVAGVMVTLYDATGTNVISTTTTDGLGNYGFNNLTPGCYVVGFGLPVGYTRTTQNAGTDTTKNSDANATTGMTNQVCVTAGQNNATIDAGIYNASNTNSVGDKVWYDENHDGLQDVTEYGYPGVVVTLYDCTTNTIIATTTTNANGNYLFDGVANGDYYVGFGFIPGYQFTGANSDLAGIAGGNNSDANPSNGLTNCISLIGNTHITTVDAGIYPGGNRTATSSLGDIVWTDANNNGIQDNGETGVSGVTVKLFDATTNTELASTITDGLGNYIFTNLLGGNYKVEFSNIPVGYTFTTQTGNIEDESNSDANTTTGMTNSIPLGLGEDKMTVDAGIVAPVNTVCLGDYVWIDLNNNGTQETTEPAVPGITVKLYDNNTNTVLQVATSNAEGKYMFCGLTNGSTYSVGFENLPAGYTFTTSTGVLATTDNSDANPVTGRTTTVTLGATNDLTLDAGIYSATTAVVGNYVWYDEDADGIQDATETPIAGVLVTLYDNTNTPVASAVTDANGKYLFTNVTPGDYTIGFAGYPSSLIPTTKGTTNPTTADDDSNIDPTTAKTDVFTVLPGSSNLTLDAGFKANPIAGLGNYVWLDVNEDGVQDASEPAIAGIIVTLYAADGTTPLATAITDGNGAYSFPNLTAGDYVVGFSNIPTGYTRTRVNGTLNDATNSDILSTNKTALISLVAGTYNPNIDAGFYIGVPLGVKELKATTAIISNTSNCQVNWFTVDEVNTNYFTIERSIDNKNFTKVGTQNAINNTTGRTNYTFQDNIEAIKNVSTIYYQIVLNDIDGKQTISNVINTKQNTTSETVSVYPIPFTNTIVINYPSTEVTEIKVELTDVSGRIIRTMNQEIAQGNNTIQLTGLENIATGTYFLRIVDNNSGVVYSQKLTK